MKRTMEEEKLLKQLDIPNFRHVTVDKLIQFSSSLSKIKDPEIQKKILEQVPGFESMALECLKSYKDLIQSSFNNSSIFSFILSSNQIKSFSSVLFI